MSLSFRQLSDANARRNNEKFPECNTWSLCDWSTCLMGEMGEAANIVKKIKLGRFPCTGTGSRPVFNNEAEAIEALGEELADTQIYLDLIAFAAGINLAEVTRKKFNASSDKLGSLVKL